MFYFRNFCALNKFKIRTYQIQKVFIRPDPKFFLLNPDLKMHYPVDSDTGLGRSITRNPPARQELLFLFPAQRLFRCTALATSKLNFRKLSE